MSEKKATIVIDEEKGIMLFENNNFSWLELAGVARWLDLQVRLYWIDTYNDKNEKQKTKITKKQIADLTETK